MTSKSMAVFALRDAIVDEYRSFATSFPAQDIRAQVEAIYAQGRFWPDPLLRTNPYYKLGPDVFPSCLHTPAIAYLTSPNDAFLRKSSRS